MLSNLPDVVFNPLQVVKSIKACLNGVMAQENTKYLASHNVNTGYRRFPPNPRLRQSRPLGGKVVVPVFLFYLLTDLLVWAFWYAQCVSYKFCPMGRDWWCPATFRERN